MRRRRHLLAAEAHHLADRAAVLAAAVTMTVDRVAAIDARRAAGHLHALADLLDALLDEPDEPDREDTP